jgi:protease-4
MILSIILLVFIGVMFLGKFASMLGNARHVSGAQSGRNFEEISLEGAGSADKLAIIDVDGIITSEPWDRSGHSMVDTIADQLKLAGKDRAVKGVILKVNSPGGEVMASDDIARAIRDFEEKYGKPVIASMSSVAASGGYYISAPCRWIVANDLTITGSIGVIMSSLNYRGLMDKIGLQPMVFKSGKFKDMLRGSKRPEEVTPEEEKMIQDMIMETYNKFKTVVREGRGAAAAKNNGKGKTLASNWEEYADGRILTGKNAYELGFVDQLGTFRTAVETAKKMTGITEANLVRYEEPFSLGRLLGMGVESKADGKTIKVDLGMELPKLQAGRMYFLSSSMVY